MLCVVYRSFNIFSNHKAYIVMQKKLVNILKIVHKKICDPTKKKTFSLTFYRLFIRKFSQLLEFTDQFPMKMFPLETKLLFQVHR